MTSATEAQARRPKIDLAWPALVAIVVVAGAASVERPGALLEVAAIGTAGAALWATLAPARPAPVIVGLTILAFVAGISNTWPGRIWALGLGHLPAGVAEIGAPTTLVLGALLLVGVRQGWLREGEKVRVRFRTLTIAACLILAGAAVSSVIARSATAADAALLEFLVPIGAGALVLRFRPNIRDAWLIVTGLLAGAAVPAFIGVAAYVVQLGFPAHAGDLTAGKVALAQPLLFQSVTFGNVDHISTLAVLLDPVALIAVLRSESSRWERAVAGAAFVLLATILVLTLSRVSLICAVAAVALVAVAYAQRHRWMPLVVATLVVAVFAAPFAIRSTTYTDNSSAGAAQTGTPSTVTAYPTSSGYAESTSFRRDAVETGLRVFYHHAPFGVGTGRYPLFDPVHTAPHSLAVEMLAENGVLALAGLATLLISLVAIGAKVLFRPSSLPAGSFELVTACVAGAGAFLLLGLAAGVALTNDDVDVWGIGVALLISLAASSARGSDAA